MAKKTTNAKKVVAYRRCVVSPKPGQTLQQLVSLALTQVPGPGDRLEPLSQHSKELRCLGDHREVDGCLCGYVTTYERGAAQPVIGDDPRAKSLRLGALPPPAPQKGGVQQQYVPGVLYFAVYQNHVALVQSSSIRGAALEAHLSWLLKERTQVLPATSSFALSDEAQKATKAKIRQSHVKSIALGQDLMTEVSAPQPERSPASPGAGATGKKPEPRRFRPQGPVVDMLRNLFQDEAAFERLGLDEVFDGNLEVWIEIRYPKRKRSKPEDTMKLMDTLGIALRDIDADQVALKLANGLKVTGKELKISAPLQAPILGHGLPDEGALWKEMAAWLRQQLEDGVVDP